MNIIGLHDYKDMQLLCTKAAKTYFVQKSTLIEFIGQKRQRQNSSQQQRQRNTLFCYN